MSDRPDIRLELVSNPIYLCGVREFMATVGSRLGFDSMQCSQIALAVDEALANVIVHGYERRPDGRIWVTLEPLADDGRGVGVRIVIEDEARQIDPVHIKGRALEDIRPGGLGVHIIREVMDEARYEKRERVGMRLTLVKRQGSPAKGVMPATGTCRVIDAPPGAGRGDG